MNPGQDGSEEKKDKGADENLPAEEQVSAEKKMLEELERKLADLNDKYIRLYSEFENYKKRVAKERTELVKYGGEEAFKSMLPVLDDFERGIRSIETTADVESLKQGKLLIYQKMKNILSQRGLEEIDAMGQEFDTDRHEAITNAAAPSEEMKGKVMDVLEKGYMLHGKVIRFAKVVVGI